MSARWCGHVDAFVARREAVGLGGIQPGGAVQGKATDSKMAANMSFVARAGHPCGADFVAADFLDQHPEYAWQKPLLRRYEGGTVDENFRRGKKPTHTNLTFVVSLCIARSPSNTKQRSPMPDFRLRYAEAQLGVAIPLAAAYARSAVYRLVPPLHSVGAFETVNRCL